MNASSHIRTLKVSTDTAAGLAAWAAAYVVCILGLGVLLMIGIGDGGFIDRLTDLKMVAIAVPGALGLAAVIVPFLTSRFAPRGTWMFDHQGVTHSRRNRLPVQLTCREITRIYWHRALIRIRGKRRTIAIGSLYLTSEEWEDVRAWLTETLGGRFDFPTDNRSGWIDAKLNGPGTGEGDAPPTSPVTGTPRDKTDAYARHYD